MFLYFSFLLLPSLSLALAAAVPPPLAAAAVPHLSPRFNEEGPTTPSKCYFSPNFLSYRTKALVSRPAKAEVIITDKTTEEKGDIGSGLHDNLLGQCGRDGITNWQQPVVLGTEMWTSRVVAYSVWFDLRATSDPGCIERAIQIAEDQTVTCGPF